jgi:hypothetical protein
VDGFDQDQCASERDEGAIAIYSLLASHGDTLESFQLADCLLHPGAGFVEQLRKEPGPVLGVRSVRDDRDDAAFATSCAIGC